MAGFIIVSGGGSLYRVNTSTGVATALTLPDGVTIDAARVARMAVLGRNVIVVNAPNRSLLVDPDFNVYPLGLRAPTTAPVLSNGDASGSLTGTFRAAYTHKVKDAEGNVLLESAMSPTSAAHSITSLLLQIALETSPDEVVTHRGIYRTISNGSTLLPWFDLDGNELTTYQDGISDALLATIAAPTDLGSPPGTVPGTRMRLVTEWKGRLWGVGDIDIDELRHTGAGTPYSWSGDFSFEIDPRGDDAYGITGLLRRRDELGIARRRHLWKIVGEDPDTFEPILVVEGKGVFGSDTVVVIRDVAYFLAEDGVYTWGPDGVKCISDEKVRGWFATDTYFNRALFPDAFGKYNARYHTYELHLAAAGSSTIDRWVSYDIATGCWFGPHKTDAFTPSFAGEIVDANELTVPVILSTSGHIYKQNRSAFLDDATAIAMNCISKSHSCDTPDITKLFHDWSMISKVEAAAGSLSVGVAVGALGAAVSKTFAPDLRLGRERFDVLGPGRFCRFEFTEGSASQGCELYGYELPFHELGRR